MSEYEQLNQWIPEYVREEFASVLNMLGGEEFLLKELNEEGIRETRNLFVLSKSFKKMVNCVVYLATGALGQSAFCPGQFFVGGDYSRGTGVFIPRDVRLLASVHVLPPYRIGSNTAGELRGTEIYNLLKEYFEKSRPYIKKDEQVNFAVDVERDNNGDIILKTSNFSIRMQFAYCDKEKCTEVDGHIIAPKPAEHLYQCIGLMQLFPKQSLDWRPSLEHGYINITQGFPEDWKILARLCSFLIQYHEIPIPAEATESLIFKICLNIKHLNNTDVYGYELKPIMIKFFSCLKSKKAVSAVDNLQIGKLILLEYRDGLRRREAQELPIDMDMIPRLPEGKGYEVHNIIDPYTNLCKDITPNDEIEIAEFASVIVSRLARGASLNDLLLNVGQNKRKKKLQGGERSIYSNILIKTVVMTVRLSLIMTLVLGILLFISISPDGNMSVDRFQSYESVMESFYYKSLTKFDDVPLAFITDSKIFGYIEEGYMYATYNIHKLPLLWNNSIPDVWKHWMGGAKIGCCDKYNEYKNKMANYWTYASAYIHRNVVSKSEY